MDKSSLTALVDHHLGVAGSANSGRSSETLYGGHEHVLRQTLIALQSGQTLDEHENPGEATIQVLRGQIRLRAGDATIEASAGELLIVPQSRHSLDALEDAAILLTVAKALS